jgi:ribosomal protein S18 acetylase RimI-like enzyme
MTETSTPDSYRFSSDSDEAYEEYVTTKLVEFNKPLASPLWQNPPHPRAPLQIYVIDRHEIVVGGLIGRTHAIPEWLEISIIWVDETVRGRGIGRQLMQLAETQARQRGCLFVRLSTAQYQAPGFYQKLGYTVYGTLANLPRGETAYYLWKELGLIRMP